MHTSIHRSQGASEESRTLDQYEVQGMVVRKFAQEHRTKEFLSPEGNALLQFVVEVLQKHGVSMRDILCTELVNGYVLEVPRIERSLVFRDMGEIHSVAIRTTTHIRYVTIDDENTYGNEIKEALIYNLQDRADRHGMMENVASTRNEPAQSMSIVERDMPAWIGHELQQLSPMERVMKDHREVQQVADNVDKIKRRFPTAREFIGAGDVGRMSTCLDVVGAFYEISDAVKIPGDRVLLAAKIYGESDPAVLRAHGVIMKERMETHRKTRQAML